MIKLRYILLVIISGFILISSCQEYIEDEDAPLLTMLLSSSYEGCGSERIFINISDNYIISKVDFFINDIDYTDYLVLYHESFDVFTAPLPTCNNNLYPYPGPPVLPSYPCLNNNSGSNFITPKIIGRHHKSYYFDLNNYNFENGTNEFKCIVYDSSENVSNDILIYEINDDTPPNIEIVTPFFDIDSCQIINGINVIAEDNIDICNIEYYINDTLVFRTNEYPYTLPLSYFRCSDFIHADSIISIHAVAMDLSYNKAISNILNIEPDYFIQCAEELCYNEMQSYVDYSPCIENQSECHINCHNADGGGKTLDYEECIEDCDESLQECMDVVNEGFGLYECIHLYTGE